jgi:hypothetical protein
MKAMVLHEQSGLAGFLLCKVPFWSRHIGHLAVAGSFKRPSHRLELLIFFHLVHPACPVGPKDRTGVNPVKRIPVSLFVTFADKSLGRVICLPAIASLLAQARRAGAFGPS